MSTMALLATGATPQAPPIKQGLWKIAMTMTDAKGKETNPFAAQASAMKSMPPMVLEMMKKRGLPMAQEDGTVLSCMTKESMDSGQWRQISTGCNAEYKETTAKSWKWHTSCPSLKSESDGETIFVDSENYHMNMVTTRGGKVTTMKQEAKFVSANCGDVKPFTAESVKLP